MADSFRFRFNQKKLVKVPVDSATVISKGDLVALVSDKAIPMSSFTWTTDLATTQGNAAAAFLGVAEESTKAGETDDISVDVSSESVYEMDCTSATYQVGDPIAPAKASGNALLSQQVVEAVGTASIGRVYRRTNGTATKVHVTFASAFTTDSSNTNAAIG